MYLLVKHRNEIFTTQFYRIMYCIPPESQHQKETYFQKLKKECREVELILGLPKEENVLDNTLPKLIIIGKQQLKAKEKHLSHFFDEIKREQNVI